MVLVEYFVSLPSISYSFAQLFAIHQLAKHYQGDAIELHETEGGLLHSNWRAFGVSLLILAAILAVISSAVLLWVGVLDGGIE